MLRAFLSFWRVPDEEELRLWQETLAPVGDDLLREVFIAWLRDHADAPRPVDLIRLSREIQRGGDMLAQAQAFCLERGVTFEQMRGTDRTLAISHLRQDLMQVLAQTGGSVAAIAALLRRDRATVAFGIRAAAARQGAPHGGADA